jgi:uncharacterized membrane protein YqjE
MTVDQRSNEDLRDRPVGDLLKQLSEDTATLVRKEVELARAEVTEKGKQAGIGAGMFGGAGVAALLALGSLTACLIALLATGMKVWIAALIVTVLWAAIAGVLALLGRGRVQEATPPVEQTVETIKEDVQWAKTQKPSAGK